MDLVFFCDDVGIWRKRGMNEFVHYLRWRPFVGLKVAGGIMVQRERPRRGRGVEVECGWMERGWRDDE